MKSFLKDILKRMAVTLVSSILFAILSIFLIGALFSSLLKETELSHDPDSILTLSLSMNLTDRPGGFRLEDLTRQALTEEAEPPQLHLYEVLEALKKAKTDPKVKALFISGGFVPSGYGCGYASIHEFIKGIKDFKKSNKPVVGYLRNPSQLDYLVYSACDELHMDPSGSILLSGLASQSIFLGEALEKYGIGMQVVRTGDFKGAVEPFTSTEFSAENRHQIDQLISQRWGDYIRSVSENRSFNTDELQSLLEEKYLFQAQDALGARLVDSLLPYDAMIDELIELGSLDEDGDFKKIDFIEYLDRPQSSAELEGSKLDGEPKIHVVYVEGSIVDGWGDDGNAVGGHEIASRLRETRADQDCKAVVLRINSPGGSVSGSDAILQEIRRLRAEKIPVVVSMGSVAASGGYWISTECDQLYASEQTITGSIGVFGLLPNLKKMASEYSVYWDAVKTHDHSDIMTIARPKTEAELQVIQEYVNGIYQKFIGLVADARKINPKRVDRIAEGRVWSGLDAKRLGLVDGFGGLRESIQKAAELAKLEPGSFGVKEVPALQTPFQALEDMFAVSQGGFQSTSSGSSLIREITEELENALSSVQTLNDPRHAYGLLPWYRRGFGFVD
ncbi:MAG: signal peptide peptidase SppA [Verrucomicrobiota bacterium]|nr:signal peptide peptidase SppA [Verrucomicrobiota bacterium]